MRRPDLVIAAAIVICLPMAPAIMNGGIDPTTALVRFLIALVVCAAGSAIIDRVWRGYADQARRTAIIKQLTDRSPLEQEPGPTDGPPPATGAPGHP